MNKDNKFSLKEKKLDSILVVDFGSQYTQLIARRVRELGVYSEIFPWDISLENVKVNNPKGIILSGGPESVTKANTPRIPEHIFKLNVPILGICYGMQTLAEQFGGQVSSSKVKEFGHAEIVLEQSSMLFDGHTTGYSTDVWMSHGDCVSALPDEFNLIASTSSVYGGNVEMPYREIDPTDTPLSFYAATKNPTNLWLIAIVTYLIYQLRD